MSVDEKLEALKLAKSRIRAALVSKNIKMDNVPFSEYHTKIPLLKKWIYGTGGRW